MNNKIFISYAQDDGNSKDVARRLKNDLENHDGYEVFMDEESISPGKEISHEIDKHISEPNLLFFALISEAYTNSEWCNYEWDQAVERNLPLLPAVFGEKNDNQASDDIDKLYIEFVEGRKLLVIRKDDFISAAGFAREEIIKQLNEISKNKHAVMKGCRDLKTHGMNEIVQTLVTKPEDYRAASDYEPLSGVIIITEACTGLVKDEVFTWRDRITNSNVIAANAFFGVGAVLLAEIDDKIILHLDEKSLESLNSPTSSNALRAVMCASLAARTAIEKKGKDYKGSIKIFALGGNQIFRRKKPLSAPGKYSERVPGYIGGDLGAIQRVLKTLYKGDIVFSEKAVEILRGQHNLEPAVQGLDDATLVQMQQPYRYLDGFDFRHEYRVYKVGSKGKKFPRINENQVRSLIILDGKSAGDFTQLFSKVMKGVDDELHNITFLFPIKGARKIILRLDSPDDTSHIETMRRMLAVKAFPVSHFIHTILEDPIFSSYDYCLGNQVTGKDQKGLLAGRVGALVLYQFNSVDVSGGDDYLNKLRGIAKDVYKEQKDKNQAMILDVGKLYGQFEAYSLMVAADLSEVEKLIEESLNWKYLSPLNVENVNIEVMPFSIEKGFYYLGVEK